MPFSRLFRSRWSAIFWAGGIVWTAYDVASSAPAASPGSDNVATDALGNPVSNADVDALKNAFGN